MPPISSTVLEQLLWEEEGTEVDFKRDQYPFIGATDDQKSEIIKDVISFANAWRRSDAYVLLGVDEVRGGRSIPRGVSEHLPEAALQQLVNSKTQRPVTFSYHPMTIDGLAIGVVHIPLQERPIYLTRAYGKLKADTVYIRRGSSTDIAKPDEIARMTAQPRPVASAPFLVPELVVQNTRMIEYDVQVWIQSRSPVAPASFRVDIQIPDDFAHPSVGFPRQVRHENGYRHTQTTQDSFAGPLFENDRVLVQTIHFRVMPEVPADGRPLQKRFRVEVRADSMATQTVEQPLAEVLGRPLRNAVQLCGEADAARRRSAGRAGCCIASVTASRRPQFAPAEVLVRRGGRRAARPFARGPWPRSLPQRRSMKAIVKGGSLLR